MRPLSDRTYRGPVKSTPVTVKGADFWTRSLGRGAGSGALKATPSNFLQVTHDRSNLRTYWRMQVIQKVCRSAVTVALTPECSCFLWVSYTMSVVRGCSFGNRNGNLVTSLRLALWILPPQRRNPSSSRNSRSCHTTGRRVCEPERRFEISVSNSRV